MLKKENPTVDSHLASIPRAPAIRVRRPDPLDHLFQDLTGGLFGALRPDFGWLSDAWNGTKFEFEPSLDLAEEAEALVLTAELPGLTKDQIHLEFKDGILRLYGSKETQEEKKEAQWFRRERRFGSFDRRIQLPVEIDSAKISAEFKDGVLRVFMPKSQPDEKAKTIKIKA